MLLLHHDQSHEATQAENTVRQLGHAHPNSAIKPPATPLGPGTVSLGRGVRMEGLYTVYSC